MSFNITDAGLHSLLVDLGRSRVRTLGVPLGGAADRFAFQLGNLLVGNEPDAVAMEVTLKGPTLRAEAERLAVVFGAPFVVTVNGREVTPNTTFRLAPGDTLRIGGTPTGCRAYLCIAGGFDTPTVLGSRSGLEAVKVGDRRSYFVPLSPGGEGLGVKGDALHLPSLRGGRREAAGGESALTPSPLPVTAQPTSPQRGEVFRKSPSPLPPGERGTGIRALPGPQADWFPPDAFFGRPFTVSPASNRMGVRLLGEPIPKRAGELASEPVAPGAVQITNDGLPIVLGVDGQTIGGYPKVAHVIRADLDWLGQLRPGDAVRFALVSADEAEAAAEARARELRLWRMRIEVRGGLLSPQ